VSLDHNKPDTARADRKMEKGTSKVVAIWGVGGDIIKRRKAKCQKIRAI